MTTRAILLFTALTFLPFQAATACSDLDFSYPEPVEIDSISEKDKRDPDKVVEALTNSFLEAFRSKAISEKTMQQSSRYLMSITCSKFNYMKQLYSNGRDIGEWTVTSVFLSPQGSTIRFVDIWDASSRDLAAGYAMCDLWKKFNIPMDKFVGFDVEKVNNVKQ